MNDDLLEEAAHELCRYELLPAVCKPTYKQLHSLIAEKINALIATDFSKLISLLYRLDICEKDLKIKLGNAGSNASANIIATMIIERQLQKIETRKNFKFNHFSDEEKW